MAGMAFLLRVQLPDVPGSLGAVASALGTAGADINAIEIVEHRADGFAVDDVLLELPPGAMPDSLVSACHRLDDVRVLWVSRYDAGASLRLDLEAVETMTQEPKQAVERLVAMVPETFRCDWSLAVSLRPDGGAELLAASGTAPDLPDVATDWLREVSRPRRLPEHADWSDTVLAGAPLGEGVVVLGRRGGPEVLDSELARFGHLCGLAATISSTAG